MRSLAAAAFGLLLCSSAALAATPEGTWLSQDGGTKVHLSKCGGKLCGTVVWLNHPIDPATGRPKTDKHNPDPAKRARPLIGLKIASGLAPSGPNQWSGLIYNADDGRVYQASFKVEGPSVAKVQGCVLALLCKSKLWTRSD